MRAPHPAQSSCIKLRSHSLTGPNACSMAVTTKARCEYFIVKYPQAPTKLKPQNSSGVNACSFKSSTAQWENVKRAVSWPSTPANDGCAPFHPHITSMQHRVRHMLWTWTQVKLWRFPAWYHEGCSVHFPSYCVNPRMAILTDCICRWQQVLNPWVSQQRRTSKPYCYTCFASWNPTQYTSWLMHCSW